MEKYGLNFHNGKAIMVKLPYPIFHYGFDAIFHINMEIAKIMALKFLWYQIRK